MNLDDLVKRGLLRGLPKKWRDTPPRIAAASPRERAALGYLHGNCGSCHNATGPLASLGLQLDYPLEHAERRTPPAIRSAVGKPSRYQVWQDRSLPRIAGGAPDDSTLVARLTSRAPVAVMPPLGTRAVDADALALIREWIAVDLDPTTVALATKSDRRSSRTPRNHEKHR
jgi:mono/diheme cytochrome c family protein